MLSVGAVVGCGTDTSLGQNLTGSGGSDSGGSNSGGLTSGGPALGSGAPSGSDPTYAPTPPFALSATAELSEDFFTVINHPVDPKHDTVIAYSRADGTVEAMLLQGGIVRQIYRDPTQPGGWNVYPLPDADEVTGMVAAMSGPYTLTDHTVMPATLKVFYTTKRADAENTLIVATENVRAAGAAPSFTTSTRPWSSNAYDLQLSVNYDNSLLVSALTPSTTANGTDARLYYYCSTLR